MTTLTNKAYSGVLFGITADKRKEKGPVLQGSITLEKGGKETVYLAAFARLSKAGDNYYSLSVGGEGVEHQYGALFPVANKRSEAAPDYTGTIDLVKDSKERLRVAGWTRKSDSGVVYVSIAISLPNPDGAYDDKAPAEVATA